MKTIVLLLLSISTFAQLPTTGSLSLKSAAGSGRSISQQVDGNETGSKSLSTLSTTAGFSTPHSMLEFRGYPSASVPGNITVCNAVQNSTVIDVTWANPTSGGTPTYIEIKVAVNGPTLNHLTDVTYPGTSYPHGGLTDGNTYQYFIKAFNSAGGGLGGCTTTAVTYNAPDPPNTPTSLVAARISGSIVRVTWNYSGPSVSHFELWESVNGDAYTIRAYPDGVERQANRPGEVGNTYRYQLRAINGGGSSGFATSNLLIF